MFFPCSYPTYEEWKQYMANVFVTGMTGSSYPTYEEWKHCTSFDTCGWCISSYPTYEEWKLDMEEEAVRLSF